ncbi:hypothetical protein CFAM422_005743 [Trichoderma lentiforme]|uniref:Uncharacterized protein n=1 Tax=Trichoderma lentiforme TaxID=1567552 RepID=A0A9P4XG34_9HYPO|nr:hypothetical protein CFAM422_005743 [Trichoderma lentiforme]
MEASYEVLGDSHSEGDLPSESELEDVNGEEVRANVEGAARAYLVKTGFAAAAFVLSVVGLWGDGAPRTTKIFADKAVEPPSPTQFRRQLLGCEIPRVLLFRIVLGLLIIVFCAGLDGKVSRGGVLLSESLGDVVGLVEADEAALARADDGGDLSRLVLAAEAELDDLLSKLFVAQALDGRALDKSAGGLGRPGVELVGSRTLQFGLLGKLVGRDLVLCHLGRRAADGVLSVQELRLEVDEDLDDGDHSLHDGSVETSVTSAVEHVQFLTLGIFQHELQHIHNILRSRIGRRRLVMVVVSPAP